METRWKVLCLLFVTRIALGFQFQVVGSVTPALIEELQLNYRLSGTLVGLFLFAGIFLSFPAGLAQRYVSDKTLVVSGLLILGAGGFLSGVSSGYDLIAVGRIVSGAGFVFSTLYFTKMVADWFGGKELATAMAILVMSWPVGIALGQVLHPVIAESYSYSAAFHVASLYGFISALALWWCFKAPDHGDKAAPDQKINWSLSRYYLTLTILAALVWALFNAVFVIYLSFVNEVLIAHGFTARRAGIIGSIPSWIMVFTAIAAGQLVDRAGHRNLVLYISLILSAVSLTLLSLGTAIVANIILLGTIGFGCAGVIMSLTADAMPAESRAFGMGVFFTVYFAVGLPAPGIAGWLYDISGNVAMPMIFASGLCLLGAFCNWQFARRMSTDGDRVAARE